MSIFFFLVISVNYCCCHHFSTKAILVKLKILNILMQWLKWFIFWMFLHCKLITSFLELFLATCFLCILQTQLTRRNCHHMMTKVTFVNFFIKTYSTLSIPYKISCKMDKNFLRYMFFLTPPRPSSLEFFWEIFWENTSQKYNNLWAVCQIWFNKSQNFRVKLYYTKFSA